MMNSISYDFKIIAQLWCFCCQCSICFTRCLESNNLRATLKRQCHPRVIRIIHLNGDSFIFYYALIA